MFQNWTGNLRFVGKTAAIGTEITFPNYAIQLDDHTQKVTMPYVYSNVLGSYRDLGVEAVTFDLGYISSLTAHKMNIDDISDTSAIFNLFPKTYNRRMFHDGPTNIPSEELSFGFLAEEVATVDHNLCFYDWWEKKNTSNASNEAHPITPNIVKKSVPELSGIKTLDYVAILVKIFQEQKMVLDALEARIATLESS